MAGQIGLEASPDEYVAAMVGVFREVRRVLRDDGTLWLNIGDSYAGSGKGGNPDAGKQATNRGSQTLGVLYGTGKTAREAAVTNVTRRPVGGCKSKDLIGIPWLLAFALRNDGWWLRSDIIWSKPNPMPESVTDRPTKAHEYLFLFAKGQRKSRVVKFTDLPRERIHFGKYLGLYRPDFGPNEVSVILASQLFDRTQRQQQFSLPPFYAQEWKKLADNSDSDFVRSLPPEHRATVWAARFLDADATAEEFLHQLDCVRLALGDGDQFLVGGVAVGEGFDTPSIYSDREGTVTVHHAGKVSKIEFAHKRIVVSTPTTCNYHYDAAAIKETSITEDLRRPYTSEGAWQIDGRPAEQRHGGEPRGGTYRQPNSPGSIKLPHGQGFITRRAAHGQSEEDYARLNGRQDALHNRTGRTAGNKSHKYVDAYEASETEEHRTKAGLMKVADVPWYSRNKRSVWTVATAPYSEAHFATFPPALIAPCVLAGCPVGGTVLDPFLGSGTTAMVAEKLGRDCIGVELNPEYSAMAERRCREPGLRL